MASLPLFGGKDMAEKFFGTPERKLRRRDLHPWGWGAETEETEIEENGESQAAREETDDADLSEVREKGGAQTWNVQLPCVLDL